MDRPPAMRRAAGAVTVVALVVCIAVAGWAVHNLARSGAPAAEAFGSDLLQVSDPVDPPVVPTPAAAPTRPATGIIPPARRSAALQNFPAAPHTHPVRVSIPAVGLQVEIDPVGVRPDGQLTVPEESGRAGWYRYGPSPGHGHAVGSVVVAGHLDSAAGREAFFGLTQVAAGDDVVVDLDDGSRATYRIVGGDTVAKTDLPTRELFRRDGEPVLRLITCTGAWSPRTGHYLENLVITAVPLDDDPTATTSARTAPRTEPPATTRPQENA